MVNKAITADHLLTTFVNTPPEQPPRWHKKASGEAATSLDGKYHSCAAICLIYGRQALSARQNLAGGGA